MIVKHDKFDNTNIDCYNVITYKWLKRIQNQNINLFNENIELRTAMFGNSNPLWIIYNSIKLITYHTYNSTLNDIYVDG